MSVRERFSKGWKGFLHPKEDITVFRVEDARDKGEKLQLHQLTPPDYTTWQGIPRTVYGGGDQYDYLESRRLSITPTPRMCILRKKLDVMNTSWEIVPLMEEGKDKPSDDAVQHAHEIFNWLYFRPNSNGEPFSQLLGKMTDDIETHDAGVWTKIYAKSGNRHLVELHARDGALFTKDMNPYLQLGVVQPNYTMDDILYENLKVGYWYNWATIPKVAYEPHEVVYVMHDPRTDVPYGTSKMYTLKSMLYSLMYENEYFYKYWEQGGKNPAIIGPDVQTQTSTGIMEGSVFDTYKTNLKDQMKEYMTRAVTNSKTAIAFLSDPKALQWLETQESYMRLTIALFNETPAILGWTKDIHKATDESQKSIYIQRGLWPLLRTIEWYMNTQVIADFFWIEEKERNIFAHNHKGRWAGKPMDCLFRFKLYDPIGEKQELDIDSEKLKHGLTKINDVLKAHGKPQVTWGDINPLFLLNVQQWCQGYMNGGIDPDVFKNVTGIEPAIKEIQQATQTTVQPADAVTAYKHSRTEVAAPKFAKTAYPKHEKKE